MSLAFFSFQMPFVMVRVHMRISGERETVTARATGSPC